MEQPSVTLLNASRTAQVGRLTEIALGVLTAASNKLETATITETGYDSQYPDESVAKLATLQHAAADRLTKLMQDPANWMIDQVGTDAVKDRVLQEAEYWRLKKLEAAEHVRPCRQLRAQLVRVPGAWLAVHTNETGQLVGRGNSAAAAFADFDAQYHAALSADQIEQEKAAQLDKQLTQQPTQQKPRGKKK